MPEELIRTEDFYKFFDEEANAAIDRWNKLMELPIEDRIRKRKAIKGVTLDPDFRELSEDDGVLLKVSFKQNLSDFKEGECLILHRENIINGIECTLIKFEGENTLILSVYPPNMPPNLYEYKYRDLILDQNLVDLREHVYNDFIYMLPYGDEHWEKQLINTQQSPTFKDLEACRVELDDTIKNFKLNLTDTQKEAVIHSMAAQDYYLVQGPPGTGKSFVLSLIILEENLYFNHKVIVIGPNHMAINNTLIQSLKQCPCNGWIVKVGQSYHAPHYEVQFNEKTIPIHLLRHPDIDYFNACDNFWTIGLTPHSLYSNRAIGLECDTLIIDEAGQMTIPLAMMGMINAKKVILAGDHKQLPPIITSEKVPAKMKKSIFERLMTSENCTLLDVSFRMCKAICDFVSELFYDGAVKPFHSEGSQLITGGEPLYDFNHPIILHHIDDNGLQTSDQEAEFITATIADFVKKGVPASEIGVLSPFRAQAANIRRHFRKCAELTDESKEQLTSDTVDKMQGQEREIIIFSLTAGDREYIHEMADFLYNPNKLNVAFSRAKSKLIIVGNLDEVRQISEQDFPHIGKMLNSELVTIL